MGNLFSSDRPSTREYQPSPQSAGGARQPAISLDTHGHRDGGDSNPGKRLRGSQHLEEQDNAPPETRNVVLFGSSGHGKSSLVNLLNDHEDELLVSDRACGTTFDAQYRFNRTHNVRLCDTAGLDEGSSGRSPNVKSFEKLAKLLYELRDGCSLLVMIKRHAGGSITTTDQKNYEIFVETLAQDMVPKILVVTGCEHNARMEDWAAENKPYFTAAGLCFDEIVSGTCVKGLPPPDDGMNARFEEKRKKTKDAVWKAIHTHIACTPIMIARGDNFWEKMRRVWNAFIRQHDKIFHRFFFSVRDDIREKLLQFGCSKDDASRIASYFPKWQSKGKPAAAACASAGTTERR